MATFTPVPDRVIVYANGDELDRHRAHSALEVSEKIDPMRSIDTGVIKLSEATFNPQGLSSRVSQRSS
jgi:hypothetical protein